VEQDRRDFGEFYTAARDDCLRIVLINVGNRELAEDLVAEAFTRAWMSWHRVRGLAAPRARVVQLLGMPSGTVASHLHRGLAALRRDIAYLDDQELAT